MTVNEIMDKINADLTYYEIATASRAIGEEGKYVSFEDVPAGYSITNKLTGVIEHTSTILPGVIFQAQHFDNTLKSFLQTDEKPAAETSEPTDDVILN